VRSHLLRSACLSIAISSLLQPKIAWAAEPAAPAVAAGGGMVEIVVEETYAYEDLQISLQDLAERALKEEAVVFPGEADAPWRIRIELLGLTRDYRFTISARRGDTVVVAQGEHRPCACNTNEVLMLMDKELRQVIDHLKRSAADAAKARAAAAAAVPEPQPEPEPQPLEPEPQLSPPERGGFGALGIVGTVLGAGGLGMLIAGAVEAGKGEVREEGPEGTTIRDHHTAATDALMGVGAGVIAAGIVLIVVDQVVCKKRPRGCRASRGSEHAQVYPLGFQF